MSLFGSFDISASALTAERLRMDVTAENLANAETTRTANGGPYRRKEVVLEQQPASGGFGASLATAMGASSPAGASGVQVAGIVEDQTPLKTIYDPGNPDADARGYVKMPNVDTVTEMTDLISASRSYEANVTAMQTGKEMYTKTLDLLK
jgi:flagellar basal-body rod protein FlgC